MRNLEKGQHIFIAFQNRKAVLDSQLRPRMYTSLENADKWTPTVNKGKIEYVEYAPTLTPPNEWISVEDRLPKLQDNDYCWVMVLACKKTSKESMPMFYERTLVRKQRVERWKYYWDRIATEDDIPDFWMPLPQPPKEE